jgi:hypothetical protein
LKDTANFAGMASGMSPEVVGLRLTALVEKTKVFPLVRTLVGKQRLVLCHSYTCKTAAYMDSFHPEINKLACVSQTGK